MSDEDKKAKIMLRKGSYVLRQAFDGKTREISLGKNRGNAQTIANRFVEIAKSSSYGAALEHLKGKEIIKPGVNLTFEEIKKLYAGEYNTEGELIKDGFCQWTDDPPRPDTIKHNLDRLKLIMKRAGAATIKQIDKDTLLKKWLCGKELTDSRRVTFNSALGAAASIFTAEALAYYAKRRHPVENPFKGIKKKKPEIKQYSPLSPEVRDGIWTGCLTELSAPNAMVVRMALGCGLRRSEIEAALVTWFVPQTEGVNVYIACNENFKTKNGKDQLITISREDYEVLLKLRGECDSPFFVPSESKKEGKMRLRERFLAVNEWLKTKQSTNAKPLHGLRKDLGSILAKKEGIPNAAKFLRNTIAVCSDYYVGVEKTSIPNIAESIGVKPVDPLEAVAAQFNMTVEELKKKLAS